MCFPELFKFTILIQQYAHSTLSNLTKYPDNQILLFLKFPFKDNIFQIKAVYGRKKKQ